MRRQTKIAYVLASVSFIALATGSGPASAGGSPFVSGSFTGTWKSSEQTSAGSRDFITFDDYDVTGDVEIDTDIGASGSGIYALTLENGSLITGDLIIDTGWTSSLRTSGRIPSPRPHLPSAWS